jgi:hypothetical protein
MTVRQRQRTRRKEALAPKATQLATVRPGRPLVHTEPWEKITVVMLERHAAYLDVMSVLMRMRHHRSVSRAEFIRALVEFMDRSRIDFTQFAAVEQMVEYLIRHFRRIPNRGRLPLLLESSLFHPERAASRSAVVGTRGARSIEVTAT